jgi:16S rRNA (cytidine1402-2'-O)-methyltransferase
MDDLSPRAVETLRRSALIACEDTRVTRALLQRHAITTSVVSCHKFNEADRVARILDILAGGRDVALVSDGGTPAVSDPGALIVRAVRGAGGRAVPIPGPSAALWSVSGFPAGPFTVVGFLPQRRGERRRVLEGLRCEVRPLVFFESPHRILGMLADAAEILGDRAACLGREMTKLHEEYLAASLKALHATFAARTIRGEFALVVAGADPSAGGAGSAPPDGGGGAFPGEPVGDRPGEGLDAAAAEVSRLVAGGVEKGAALRQVARATRLPRRAIYTRLVRDREIARRRDRAAEEE